MKADKFRQNIPTTLLLIRNARKFAKCCLLPSSRFCKPKQISCVWYKDIDNLRATLNNKTIGDGASLWLVVFLHKKWNGTGHNSFWKHAACSSWKAKTCKSRMKLAEEGKTICNKLKKIRGKINKDWEWEEHKNVASGLQSLYKLLEASLLPPINLEIFFFLFVKLLYILTA